MCLRKTSHKEYLGRTRGSVSARIHRLRKEGVYIRPFKESLSNQEECEEKYPVEKQFLYFLLVLLFLYVLITY